MFIIFVDLDTKYVIVCLNVKFLYIFRCVKAGGGMRFVGRKKEFKELDRRYRSKQSELIVVYGRRRVGKTALVREFFGNKFDFLVTGIHDGTKEMQLSNFAMALHEYFGLRNSPKTWLDAFALLRAGLLQVQSDGKKVVFFDEMPWMETPKSDFLKAFEVFWNGFAAWQKDILLVVCGSATTWLTENILNDVGGLYNRATGRIFLEPFNLCETEEFLKEKGIVWNRYDIIQLYMVMGGIPFYLDQLQSDLSLAQNIDELFFKSHGKLWNEFNNLYAALFKNADAHIKVVEALSTKKMGLLKKEISEETELPCNGLLSKILDNLSNSGFVRPYNYFGNKKKDITYQLSDYYSLFYFRFIKDNYGKDENFWQNTLDFPAKRAWTGYAFEQVCKDHVQQIKNKLGIAGVLSERSSWFGKDSRSSQIDLVIDRRDRVINLCEMKYSETEFEIDKEYDKILRDRLDAFRKQTKTKKALHITFVTVYGLMQGKYRSIAQSEVVGDDLFLAF